MEDAFAGLVGGIFCTYGGLPFDTVKVRLQTHPPGTFRGPIDCVLKTVRVESPMSLWKGAAPALLAAGLENMTVFAANGAFRKMFCPDRSDLPFKTELFLGALSGFTSATIICGPEAIKCRMQASRGKIGPLTCATDLFRAEGVRGFFRGLTACWMRDVPYYAIFFSSYRAFLSAAKIDSPSSLESFLGGGVASSIAWSCVLPFDIVKSRKQIGNLENSLSLSRAIADIAATEGPGALLRGWGPTVTRGFIANGFLMFGVEGTKHFLEKLR